MEIKELLDESRETWGGAKPTLAQIIVRLGKIFGDICRWERNAIKDRSIHTDQELKKEMGNMILSGIRWCDDLGYDPEECINEAIKCQREFKK